jgi:hypothetical protein
MLLLAITLGLFAQKQMDFPKLLSVRIGCDVTVGQYCYARYELKDGNHVFGRTSRSEGVNPKTVEIVERYDCDDWNDFDVQRQPDGKYMTFAVYRSKIAKSLYESCGVVGEDGRLRLWSDIH